MHRTVGGCVHTDGTSIQLCSMCMRTGWGPEPQIVTTLPDCLLPIVFGYLDFQDPFYRFEFDTWCAQNDVDYLRYLLCLFPEKATQLAFFQFHNCLSTVIVAPQILEYMMDRFGDSFAFSLEHCKVALQHRSFLFIEYFCRNVDVVECVFACLNLMKHVDDVVSYWFVTTFKLKHVRRDNQFPTFLQLLCRLQSLRCIEILFDNDIFCNQHTLLFTLEYCAQSADRLHIFRFLWNEYFKDGYSSAEKFLLSAAFQFGNTPLIDFLCTRPHFAIHNECAFRLQSNTALWAYQHHHRFRALFDDARAWYSHAHYLGNLMLLICVNKRHDDVIRKLSYVADDRMLIESIAKHDNWEFFFQLTTAYPEMEQHIDWYLVYQDACRSYNGREYMSRYRIKRNDAMERTFQYLCSNMWYSGV